MTKCNSGLRQSIVFWARYLLWPYSLRPCLLWPCPTNTYYGHALPILTVALLTTAMPTMVMVTMAMLTMTLLPMAPGVRCATTVSRPREMRTLRSHSVRLSSVRESVLTYTCT